MYETRDKKYMAVGAIEKRFYDELVVKLGLTPGALPDRDDQSNWVALRAGFAAVFAQKTRDEWAAIFADGDACVTPVLDLDECPAHAVSTSRDVFVTVEGVTGPAPAPRFSRTPGQVRNAPLDPRADTREALLSWGITENRIQELAEARVIAAR